jgi:hypothetical protein
MSLRLRTVINTLLKLRQDGATTLNQARKGSLVERNQDDSENGF